MKVMTMEKQIAKFKSETGVQLEIKDGKPYYNSSLNLIGIKITSLPDNLTVRCWLDLCYTQISSLSDNLTIGGWIDLRGTQITSLPNNLTVGGSLYLQKTPITSLPDNLIVGGSLYLQGTQISSLPDNLIVGGGLYLQGTQITSLPDNLIIGGGIYLEGTLIEGCDKLKVNHNAPQMLSWRNGEYIQCDGIFSKVLSHKGNVWKVQNLWSKDIYFLVTDGNGKYAHGETIQDAKADLIYKISNRDKSKYNDLSLDREVSFEDAIEMYRVITGACAAGTKDFIEHRLKVKKDKYTVAELIELTKGEYQSDMFADFFNNKVA